MRRFVASLASLLLCLGASCAFAAPAESDERVALAHILSFGELPAVTEPSSAPSLAARLVAHREILRTDAATRTAVAHRAWCDAFGSAPTPAELADLAIASAPYAEALAQHLGRLARDAAAYHEVVRQAYRTVIGREAYTEEIDYWGNYDPLPFILLVGCLEDWAQRNQPGLMVTTGHPTISPHSRRLVALQVSPAVAAEGRTALGWAVAADAQAPRLLAAGGAPIATRGQMHLAIVGGEGLRTACR